MYSRGMFWIFNRCFCTQKSIILSFFLSAVDIADEIQPSIQLELDFKKITSRSPYTSQIVTTLIVQVYRSTVFNPPVFNTYSRGVQVLWNCGAKSIISRYYLNITCYPINANELNAHMMLMYYVLAYANLYAN